MANTVQLKRSAVAGKVPTTSDLALGEVGINTYDGKVYIKKDDGTPAVKQIGNARGGGRDEVFFENDQVVTTNYTITSGKNAITAGPVTINSGITVTIPSGSVWSIV